LDTAGKRPSPCPSLSIEKIPFCPRPVVALNTRREPKLPAVPVNHFTTSLSNW
jgi:hypothetical protein